MNAKYGKLDVRQFDKMHILQSLHGKICAVAVTDGDANDSPVPGQLLPFLPRGPGGDVPADSAYCNKTNRGAVSGTGRRPIVTPKANSAIRGFNAYADMLRFREEHPRTFYRRPAMRNNAGSAFSAIKARVRRRCARPEESQRDDRAPVRGSLPQHDGLACGGGEPVRQGTLVTIL